MKNKKVNMKCVIIGESSLPLRCAEIWLRKGHSIAAIVSSDKEFLQWANQRQLPAFNSLESLLAGVEKKSFDYLFSIVNDLILRGEVLELPSQLAINYHDAPLPRYAGSHATSWALLNGENTHGISWHLIAEKVDTGEILKQKSVEISAEETALTLNTKCYEAAVKGFGELVEELADETFAIEKQNLDERTFFARYKRPSAGGLINWKNSAKEISQLVRGLNFGENDNPLGSAKVLLGKEFFIVEKIEILESKTKTSAGIIKRIGEDILEVSTNDSDVRIKNLLTLDGKTIAIKEIVEKNGLTEGNRLSDLAEDSRRRIEEKHKETAKQEKYWIERLSDLEPAKTPFLNKTGRIDSVSYAKIPLRLSDEITELLTVKEHRKNNILPAVFGILLARLNDAEESDIGYFNAESFAQIKGFHKLFASHKPMRIETDSFQNFDEFLTGFEKNLEAVENRLPYPKDIFYRYPLLHQISEENDKFALPVVYASVEKIGDYIPHEGTELALVAASNDSEYVWFYDESRIEKESVVKLSEHLIILLKGIIADGKTEIAYLPLLSEAEKQLLLVDWNNNRAEYPSEKCIHQLFEEQSLKTPDAIALIDGDEHLSYRELNNRANQLADYLQEIGVKSKSLVGICAERSAIMIVGILGILKASGTYLPLDPLLPKERLKFIVNDTKLEVVLTQEQFCRQWENECKKVIRLDSDWKFIADKNQENPVCKISPDSPAYIVYTSGSTGLPKGVLVPHKSLVNHAFGIKKLYEIQPGDRMLQFATFNFDVAAEELFPALICGATVVLLSEKMRGSLKLFAEFLEKEKISVVNLPVSYWREWTLALKNSEVQLSDSLRLCITGSEKVFPEDYKIWREITNDKIQWLNAFGLTETTITSIVFDPLLSNAGYDLDNVPIGRPINNTEVYLLDKNLQPVPVGIPGELYIGGECLALGYLNQPDLTAERFIAHPFNLNPEAKLYKTGDLVRYLPNGDLEYLDRVDNQIKIRGYRIELGEIESVLAAHTELRDAAVKVHDNNFGEKSLVAYIVPHSENNNSEKPPIEMWASVGEYPVYDELMYYAMSTDKSRTSRYRAAISQLVKDKTVVEIGTGKDVILARYCISAGAKKVYAIEAIEEAYQGAKALVESLNLSDRIILIKGFSFDVELPEKVDVCVSEIIGTIGSSEGVVPILNDARRFLKEDGQMIPERCVTKIAAVQIPDNFLDSPHFSELSAKYTEKVFQEVGHKFDVRVCLKNLPKENFLSDNDVFEDLNFTKKINSEYSSEITLNITKNGRFDGFLLWLNLHTVSNAVINNLKEESSWLPVYFPIFDPGIEVKQGDSIRAICQTQISENGFNPDYKIKGALHKKNGEIIEFEHSSYHHKPIFRQTPFYQRLFPDGEINVNKIQMNGFSIQTIRQYLSEHLPGYMMPSVFVEIGEMPLLLNGKIDRNRLPAPDKQLKIAGENYEAGHNDVERKLVEIWEEILAVRPIGVRDNFFELGGHSLKAIRMFGEVEETFGKSIPIATLFQAGTIEQLAEILRQEGWSEPESSIVPIQPKGTKPPLFCIHARGGNVLFYHDLAKHLGKDQPFYGIQARRLGGRQVGHTTVEEMASFYIEEMRSVQPVGPYYIAGASFGGLAAFEMARQLREKGEEVGLLALLDTGTPDYPKLLPETTRWRMKFYLMIRRIELHRDSLKAFNWSERKEYINEKLQKVRLRYWRKFRNWRLNAMRKFYEHSKGADAIPENYIQIEDQIGKAGQNYKPQVYEGKMILYRATNQPLGIVEDETLGWNDFVDGEIEIHDVPGHHGSIIAEPSVRILAEKLQDCLDNTQTKKTLISNKKESLQPKNIGRVVKMSDIQTLSPWFVDLTSFFFSLEGIRYIFEIICS